MEAIPLNVTLVSVYVTVASGKVVLLNQTLSNQLETLYCLYTYR